MWLCLFVCLSVSVYARAVYSVECISSRGADSHTKRLSRNVFFTQPVLHHKTRLPPIPQQAFAFSCRRPHLLSAACRPFLWSASPRCCVSCPCVAHSPSLSVSFPRTISTVIEMPVSATWAPLAGRMCLVICPLATSDILTQCQLFSHFVSIHPVVSDVLI